MRKNCSGFYSRYYTPAERQMLASHPFDDLSPEIKLFRVLLLRLLSSEKSAGEALLLEDRLAGLRAFDCTTATLGRLVSTQLIHQNPISEFEKAIDEALEEIQQEMGLDNF